MESAGRSGGDDFSSIRRQRNNKRNFSAMSASHSQREGSADSLFLADDHYANDHAARRRRLREPSHPRRVHYPGDGLDFRRPVMSADTNHNQSTAVIDLTDEDGTQESQGSGRYPTSTTNAHVLPAAGSSSRAQRLPRFGRDLIEIESEGEDEGGGEDTSNLPGASYLALPPSRNSTRSRVAGLRRPARPPSPPADMDDVEFLEARPRSRPQTTSRQATPSTANGTGQQARGPQSVTPYPANPDHPTIDLTEDNDDDVVLLNSRQREGVNLGRPETTAGLGTRSLADRGFGHVGNIANLLRDGGRLMQRLQDFAGMDGEIQAQQQALDHFTHNHDRDHQHHHHRRGHGHGHGRHHHHHRPAGERAHAPRTLPPMGIRVLMDYDMTGFDMGLGGDRPPTPKYEPPPDAAAGFTRSPAEDEEVVCPNCGDELAMGDSDFKQEIWVVKACGHAYCGECAQQRGRSQPNKKGKGKAPATNTADAYLPPPFKKCVVEGCGKPTAKNSMVHVFLGS